MLITANTWRTQQKEAGNPTDLYTVIVNYDEEYAEGSLEDALQDTLYTDAMYIRSGSKITRVSRSEVEGGCAIVCDADGKVLYAFWSETPLTEEDLVPLDYDTQYEQESSLFGEGTVGWYAPE